MSAVARHATEVRAERVAATPATGPALRDRMRARVHAYALDARLAGGERADGDPLLAARAWQLTGHATRERLACALDSVLAELAELDGARGPRTGAAVPIHRREAEIARSELIRLAGRLRDRQPVAAKGVAMVRRLLCDGTSALYRPDAGDELWRALRRASIALG
jgi:hypothetical protein